MFPIFAHSVVVLFLLLLLSLFLFLILRCETNCSGVLICTLTHIVEYLLFSETLSLSLSLSLSLFSLFYSSLERVGIK